MAWTYLFLAGILEVVWAVALKFSDGFTKLWPSAITIVAMAGSIWLLSLALRILPIGTAYAVWTGIGAVGTVLIGIIALGESTAAPRLISILLILIGLAGLKYFSQ